MPQQEQNRLKCRYCDYTVYRFKGKLYGGKRLFQHVMNKHEEQFLKSVGFNGTLMEYFDMIEEDEDAV